MKKWTPEQIKKLRASYGEMQDVFCRRLEIKVETLRLWEQGKCRPRGPGRLMLDRLAEDLKDNKIRKIARPRPASSAASDSSGSSAE